MFSKSILKLSCATVAVLTLGACANNGYIPAHNYSDRQCMQMHLTQKITLEQRNLCRKGIEFRDGDPDFPDFKKQR